MAEERLLVEEQHPIPQQISAFQFRLVGDMTLKQFVQIAGGAIVALLVYASGLPPFIKWPLVLFSFGIGAALAFLPLEDRPLGKWVISFFKSIYTPTVYVWQKAVQLPTFFAPEPEATAPTPEVAQPTQPPIQAAVVKTTQQPEEAKLEEKEQTFLQKITSLSETPKGAVISEVSPTEAVKTTPAQKIKEEVVVPSIGAVDVDKDSKQRGFEIPSTDAPIPFSTSSVSPTLGKGDTITGKQAKFSDEAAPPMPPTRPNTVVGQVMDNQGKIIEGAILEIKDNQSRPVRALKTNKLGHFMIVTPLLDGRFELTTEKEGYQFEPVTFEAKGEILSPIAIRAK
jgi:hypothetical protein